MENIYSRHIEKILAAMLTGFTYNQILDCLVQLEKVPENTAKVLIAVTAMTLITEVEKMQTELDAVKKEDETDNIFTSKKVAYC